MANQFAELVKEMQRMRREMKAFEVPPHIRDALRLQAEIRKLQQEAERFSPPQVPSPDDPSRLDQLEKRVSLLERKAR